jgi:hypothetical protein
MGRRDRDRMVVGFTTMHTQSVPIATDVRSNLDQGAGSGQDVGPVKRQNGNLYICQECCNTEHCNMYGCNDPSEFIECLFA